MAALTAHEWDDAAHRAKVHEAFDCWFVAYEAARAHHSTAAERTEVRRWYDELVRLTDDARLRQHVLHPTPDMLRDAINHTLQTMGWQPEVEWHE